ncbi:MAG TPA: type I methionyl aminopeptidase [Aggregatilineales bacterium]|nr:type I methionyl aminopeptidase [Anaerolineales bacterium]HRE48410.1 type I methionyl aminopeptidase [Aggregatilineales bacterium]
MIHLKTPEELVTMREAGRIVARTHAALKEAIKPGVTTAALNKIADDLIRRYGAVPTFLGYPPGGDHPFPGAICASINNELVHGIPSETRILEEGDLLSVDVGATYKGFVGDAAFTVGVGKISPEAQRLIDVAEEALWTGIRKSRVGVETRDVSMAIQAVAEKHGVGIVREYTGHGVGHTMHEDPQVPNWWPRGRKQRKWQSYALRPGMTFALEPMFCLGSPITRLLNDHWTVIIADKTLAVHVEHTIAVTEDEPLVLTLP